MNEQLDILAQAIKNLDQLAINYLLTAYLDRLLTKDQADYLRAQIND